MITILTATPIDAKVLAELGKSTFLESHSHSASKKDIYNYVALKFSISEFERELKKQSNIYYILYYNEKPVGYSKIVFNVSDKNIPLKNVTKLERIYILEAYQKLKLGLELFTYNLNTSKKHNQSGMWLYTWIENQKAIAFYKKAGFKIVGGYDFKISDTHSNPNHQMFLDYKTT